MRHRHPRLLACSLAALLLAGCATRQPVLPTPAPTAPAYRWDERAAVTLIRADRFSAPLTDADEAARVPECAVYGDGRVRWVEPPAADAPAGALGRLLESPVDRGALADLLPRVADSGFFALAPVYGPERGPLRELAIRVEGLGTHTVRVADGAEVPAAFAALADACAELRQPEVAVEIIPEAGWIHVYAQEAPGSVPLTWPVDAPLLSLLAGQPRWYHDPALIGLIWAAQRDYGAEATFSSGAVNDPYFYRVLVRAEGITLDTPRAPREQGAALPITTPWHPSPNARVFVAWLIGGGPTAHAYAGALGVPACTVYGDGRVIISDQPEGKVRVGALTEREMTGFMEGWLASGFFDAGRVDPTPTLAEAVVQAVTIQLLDGSAATRTYPLNTTLLSGAPNPCARLTEFEIYTPTRGHLWAEVAGPADRFAADSEVTLVDWPDDLPPLAALGAPQWQDAANPPPTATPGPAPIGLTPTAEAVSAVLDNAALRFAWEHVHGGLHSAPNVLFTQRGIAYAVTFNIPGVTAERPAVLQ